MKKHLIKIGWAALSAAITAAITYGVKAVVNHFSNKSNTNVQTQAAKDLENHKLENAKDLEEKKTEERKKRLMDEEEHQRRMWEMREEQRQKHMESSQQSTVDQAFEVPYVSKVAPFKESLENDTRELEWLVGKKIEVGGRSLIYGPAGVGKSALALQMAIAIAGGTEYGFLPPEEENQHELQQVILIDLEMSAAEQKVRTRGVCIPGNLLRNTEPICNLDELFRMIEHESNCPKVTVIIDNIRKLEEEMSQPNQVNEYFSRLEQTQEKLAARGIIVTFITITHTGKDFDMYKPVQLSDVAGGADLARFSTSIYALVPGHDGNIVFKAVKQRNCASKDEVYILHFEENPNLHLEYVRACKEEEALPVKPKVNKGKAVTSKASSDAAEKPQKNAPNEKLSDDDVEFIRKGIEVATKDENDEKRKEELVKELREKYAKQFGVNPITIKRRLDKLAANDCSSEDVDDQRA